MFHPLHPFDSKVNLTISKVHLSHLTYASFTPKFRFPAFPRGNEVRHGGCAGSRAREISRRKSACEESGRNPAHRLRSETAAGRGASRLDGLSSGPGGDGARAARRALRARRRVGAAAADRADTGIDASSFLSLPDERPRGGGRRLSRLPAAHLERKRPRPATARGNLLARDAREVWP